MKQKRMTDFCIHCRKNTEYTLQKRNIKRTVRGGEYTFTVTTAICSECGEEMSIPGLIDRNIHEVDAQYRAAEGIVSVKDIQNLMKLYDIGKAPLSLVLGFGEVTITRYLAGQIPSKEYSDRIRKALSSPAFMIQKLDENKEKISAPAYHKARAAAKNLQDCFSPVSRKMREAISRVFEQLKEVTPLTLQKLLYFIQGESYALYGMPMFEEDCQAWVHGPVYTEVYHLFRDFRYNPIDDARFALFAGAAHELTAEERRVIDLVVNTFGEWGGKVLEKITHAERPWQQARKGCADGIPSRQPILKKDIADYYIEKNAQYDFSTGEGLKRYISDVLRNH